MNKSKNKDILKGSPKPEDLIVNVDLTTMKALHDSVTRETYDFIFNQGSKAMKDEILRIKIIRKLLGRLSPSYPDDAIIQDVCDTLNFYLKEIEKL